MAMPPALRGQIAGLHKCTVMGSNVNGMALSPAEEVQPSTGAAETVLLCHH